MTISLCVAFSALPAFVQAQAKAVSFAQLARDPGLYHGKLIEITGFHVDGFENSGLYPNKTWHRGQGIWVTPSNKMFAQRANLRSHYLKLTGIFNAHSHGHLGQFVGTLTVREFVLAEEPKGQ